MVTTIMLNSQNTPLNTRPLSHLIAHLSILKSL